MSTQWIPMASALAALLVLGACGGQPDDMAARTAGAQHAPAHPQAVATSAGDTSTAVAAAEPPPAASTESAADSIARLSREVAQLHREVSDLRQQFAHATGTTAAAPPGPDVRSDPQARAEAAQSERMRIASSEQSFRNQQVDPRWSQGAVASVRAALADADESLRSQVRSVECRGQSCRVEISPDAGPALQRDLPVLVNRLGQSLPNVTAGQVDQGDGRQATVLYLSR